MLEQAGQKGSNGRARLLEYRNVLKREVTFKQWLMRIIDNDRL